jgi:hypothetical protein
MEPRANPGATAAKTPPPAARIQTAASRATFLKVPLRRRGLNPDVNSVSMQ